MNPAWRERCEGRLVQGGTGGWGVLVHPGVNGLASVVVGLLGYHDVASVEDWLDCANDVAWAFTQILAEVQAAATERCVVLSYMLSTIKLDVIWIVIAMGNGQARLATMRALEPASVLRRSVSLPIFLELFLKPALWL